MGRNRIETGLSSAENEIKIQVRDDGAGIAPDVLPHIFEPFLTTKESGRGVGLGLAISRGIVERHHGRIEVESELGPGHDLHRNPAGPGRWRFAGGRWSQQCRNEGEVNAVSTQGKLLIVDDELSVRDSLGKWFHEEGYEVGTAENANDALTRLAEQRWDVALVDIKMHGTDGIELQRRMHEVDPELIVIIMTGYASVETAVAALKNGAYDYVTKPLDPDEIAHLVKNALAHKRTAQENVLLRETVAEVARPGDLVGQSGPMRKIFDAIETVGPTDATVLVTGESGTGKELVARAIHHASPRRFHPLVVIHCGASDRDAARKRTLRTREGCLHRRAVPQERQVRNRRRRHGFPGRDWRHHSKDADRPAARAAGA